MSELKLLLRLLEACAPEVLVTAGGSAMWSRQSPSSSFPSHNFLGHCDTHVPSYNNYHFETHPNTFFPAFFIFYD